MSSFKRGDKVKKKSGLAFSNGKKVATVGKIERNNVWFQETGTFLDWGDIEKVEEDMEKKYKLETELTLQEVLQLGSLTGACSNMSGLYDELSSILNEVGLRRKRLYLKPYITRGYLDHNKFQDTAKKIVGESKRKVVTVGDKKYYEDELQTALSNIKPI